MHKVIQWLYFVFLQESSLNDSFCKSKANESWIWIFFIWLTWQSFNRFLNFLNQLIFFFLFLIFNLRIVLLLLLLFSLKLLIPSLHFFVFTNLLLSFFCNLTFDPWPSIKNFTIIWIHHSNILLILMLN